MRSAEAPSDPSPADAAPSTARKYGPLWLGVALVIPLLVAALAAIRYQPIEPRAATASPTEFSAHRAYQALERVLGGGRPHPLGSAENARVRQRLIAELEILGYSPRVQSAFACGPITKRCGAVENVAVRIPGSQGGPAVMLSAHYDSVEAGPGASDDGLGVAELIEVARVLRHRPRLRHPVLLLFTDGEELGLLGAEAFVREHPWAQKVAVAINVESRGTSGPTLMFETSTGNYGLIRTLARHATRPVSTSVFYSVYQLTPNDTDLTVFRRAGMAGLGFSNIRDVVHYHTALDSLENVDLGTLQHEVTNDMACAAALADSLDPRQTAADDAVFFDLLGWRLVYWPQGWALPLALLSGALFGLAWWGHRRRIRLDRAAWGAAICLLAPVLALAAGQALGLLLSAGGALPTYWVAHPWLVGAALSGLGFTVTAAVGLAFGVRHDAWSAWAGAWLVWHLVQLVVVLTLPGFSYLFLVPCLAMDAVAISLRLRPQTWPWLVAVSGSLATALVQVPVFWLLYDAIGFIFPGLYAAAAALLTAPALAMLAQTQRSWTQSRLVRGGGVVTAIATLLALLLPAITPERAGRVTLELGHDGLHSTSRWS